jgi:PAS domain S-box-containing protein
MTGFALLAIFIGALTLVGLYFLVRQLEKPTTEDELKPAEMSQGDANAAVIVLNHKGAILYVNALARTWMKANEGAVDLEYLASQVQPPENFYALLQGEVQRSFRVGDTWVVGTSHFVPYHDTWNAVLTLRELKAEPSSATSDSQVLDVSLAMRVIQQIGESTSAAMSMEQTLQILLEIINRAMPSDAGEICLWQANNGADGFLEQRGWIGDTRYLLLIAENGGGYQVGQGLAGWVASQRQGGFIRNRSDAMRYNDVSGSPYASAVAVPLISNNNLLGTLGLFGYAENAYNDADLAFLQSISAAVATAIYNAALYSNQEKRINDISRLQELTQRGGDTDAGKLYAQINQRIAQLMNADMCGIFLYDREREVLVPQLPFYGMPDSVAMLFGIPVPKGSPQRNIWESQPYWVANQVQDEPLVEAMGFSSLLEVASVRNTALLPMELAGERIGFVAISNKRGGEGFTPLEIQSMKVLATQAGIIVGNLRIYQREQLIESELQGLQEMTQAMGSLSHEGEFYANVTERIARLMRSAMCGILLYEPSQSRLSARLPFFGISDDVVRDYVIALPQGSVMADLWEEEESWFSNHVKSDTLVYEAGLDTLAERAGVTRTLFAVMSAGGRRIGVVQVSNTLDERDYSERDARLLQIFATQAAAIVENARLYREVQLRAEQAEGLRKIAELASAVMTPDQPFTPVLEAIARYTDSKVVFINVLDKATNSLITYPRWTYGIELKDPIIQDTSLPEFKRGVATSGRAFWSDDVMKDKRVIPSYKQVGARLGLKTTLLVPLAVGDKILGELGVCNRESGYGENDVTTLSTVASQISAALERLLLYEATGENLRRRMQELDAIARVSNELALTVELDKLLGTIRHEVQTTMRADEVTIALLAPRAEWREPNVPQLARRLGLSDITVLADAEREAVLRGGEAVLVRDYANSELTPLPNTTRSSVAVAVPYLDEIVAVIHAVSYTANHFDERAGGFLVTIATKASLAYQNAEYYQQQLQRGERLRQRVDQLNRIFELGQMLQGSSSDPVMLIEAVAYSVQQSVGFDIVLMLLVDEDEGVLKRVAHAGLPLEVFERTRKDVLPFDVLADFLKPEYRTSETYFFPLEKVGQWYVEGTQALSTDYEQNRSVEGRGEAYWHDGDKLVVSISGQGGNLLGLMVLDRPYNNRRPDRATIEVLEIFAHQASTMIENTRLFIESKRSAEQEAQYNAIMNAVARTLETQDIVQAAAQGLYSLVPFQQMTLAVAEASGDGFDYVRVQPTEGGTLSLVQETRQTLERTALGQTMNTRTESVYRAGDENLRYYDDLKAWFAKGTQSAFIVPLIAGGDCLGAMSITSTHPEAMGYHGIRGDVSRVAQIVAGALQNARLFTQAVNLQTLNRSVVESIQQGIVVLDSSGRVINLNDFMRSAYGWTNDALRQDLFTYRPELADVLTDALREVLEVGENRQRLHIPLNVNGREVMTNFYVYPLRSGEVVRGAVLLMEDVTERTRLEAAIENRANQLAALTEVSTRITSLLERDEIIRLGLDEMGWIIPFDTMSIWRRNGSFMALEGATGFDDNRAMLGYRVEIGADERIKEMVTSLRVIGLSDENGLNIFALPQEVVVRSWLVVPLVNQGNVVGMMMLTKESAGSYTSREEHNVAFAFATQVAIAVANADLFEQTFARTSELGMLLEVAQATASTRDPKDLFMTVANLMFMSLEQEDCAVMTWREVDNVLVVEYASNRMGEGLNPFAKEGQRFDLNEHPSYARALASRDVLVIADNADPVIQELYPNVLADLQAQGRGARMLVPLVASDRVMGLIQVEQLSSDEHTLTQQKVRLARALGSQIAVAVENARLSAETSLRFEELLTINTLSQKVSSTLDLNDMLPVIRDQLPALTRAEGMFLALYEAESQQITFPLVWEHGQELAREPRPLGKDEVSYIIKRKHSLNLGADYFSIDELRRSMGMSNGEGDIKSFMGVPLVSGDEVVGVLAIRNTVAKRAFTLNEERVLSSVGGQLAAAIQNARLFSRVSRFADEMNSLVQVRTLELEEERDRLDTLYQITSELARTLDMEQLLERALGMVTKAVGADDAVIMLSDPATDMLYCRAWVDPNNLVHDEGSAQVTHPAMGFADWFIINSDDHDHVYMVGDLHETEYWDKEHPSGMRSAIAVLLENNEDPMGVMVLMSRRSHAFTENHLKLIVPAANQVAAAINSADLYQLIRDQAERLGRLLRAEQEEAQKQGAILEGINDGVMLADASGKVVLFNTAAERILQIPRRQVLGLPVANLARIFGESAFQWIRLINELAESIVKRANLEEMESERIQLNNLFVSTYLSPIYSGELFLGVVAVFRDVTRDVETERTKNQFITNVSHEFRTPLTPIKGYTDLLLMGAGGQLGEMQLSMVNTIKENVERLTILVNDVLNIAKIDNRETPVVMTMVNLADILPPILEQIGGRMTNLKKGFITNVTVAPDVPRIRADREKLIQIVSNLVDNAFKYTRAGGRIEVGAELEPSRKTVLIRVSDTGVGIPDHFKEAAWRRFERYDEHALELDVAGTGLGLSLVKELVELHNGETWFESEVGVGTTFFVRLPIEQPNYTTGLQ